MKKGRKKKISDIQKMKRVRRYMWLGLIFLIVLAVFLGIAKKVKPGWFTRKYYEMEGKDIDASKPKIDVQLLTNNEYSRPGIAMEKITGIVVHYTANPGSTAIDNRNYFEGLKDTHITEASSNFIIGIEGEIVQCVPTWEVAYASNSRNIDTVSIECCHPDESGKFTEETYRSMVQLCAWLCLKFDLSEKEVIRHYDVTGKNCPKYFVEDKKAWKRFRKDIKAAIKNTPQDGRDKA